MTMKLLTVLAFGLVLAGCQTAPPNPVADAQRPETVAFALYGGYVIAEKVAADLVENPNTPGSAKVALQLADAKASPVVEQLEPVAKQVASIRADIEAGGGSQTLLLTTIAKLNDWITQSAQLIKDVTDAVRGAQK